MQPSFSQRWASGAIVLAVLIACSPQTETPAATPAGALASPPVAPAAAISQSTLQEPGYAGVWALVDSDCRDASKTLNLSSQSVGIAPGEKACVVKTRDEVHPTGRSMIYRIEADCGGGAPETFTLNFGASDTVMQMTVNDRKPLRLVRCPNSANH